MEIKRFDLPLRASTRSVKQVAAAADTEYTLIYTRQSELSWVRFGQERLVQIASDSGAAMIYADHFDGERPAPVIDYQQGSLRDDFDFGGVQLYRTSALKEAAARMEDEYEFAGLYDLRLRVSEIGPLVHVNEFLYYELETDRRSSGEKLFDYVDPRNRAVQVEMEAACTAHLKRIGGYLEPRFNEVDLDSVPFDVEASVVIPCRNRVKTIGDALRSALSQETDFPYNVIVVDDNSTDGTVEVIKSFLDDPKLIYIAQDKTYHAIGGNWNAALHHPGCGRFALQLDSDDMYSGSDTVQKFVDAFREQGCAMVVGTYRITDFDLNELPPGIIDHREWTPDNGRNNALRVNGLGAPRGFWTPLLREINFPTTKYGEDYAVALRVSREYRIGRIYDVMYNCRRWGGNSDGALDIEAVNRNNLYKDRIRTWELQARIALNSR
ncbi:MAG: glycosyltransferase family 2 protein [Bacteroidales bacterium]|nr:glycosyltransferase family 2 protein [Bacteroidales bacterium]